MTTIVLLRGLMRDSRHWYGFDERLSQRAATSLFNVICVDLPGNGTLAEQKSPMVLQDYCAAVWQQIDAALIAQNKPLEHSPLLLVGLSMGGMLALTLAAQYPERIKQVVLINSSAANLSPWYQRFQVGGLLAALVKVLTNAIQNRVSGSHPQKPYHWLEATVLRFTSQQSAIHPQVITAWSKLRQQCHTSFGNGLRQLYASARFKCPKLTGVRVVVVVSNQDKLAHPKCSEQLALFYRTQLHKLEDCGHDASLDKPQQLQQLLIDTLV
ncbi:alpha/beta hydrolase [Shewanella inventionis]|uniref:alpha/beta fold hydrolase n=1 Tax=Shewanella inventionis TaxID=1738770 RepID=UPI001CBC9E77|nr:alpha/beta hydrolase [Shewanella inventionis]UAL44475.1 alpha/beta hydrolase [Shewanella inventionis]